MYSYRVRKKRYYLRTKNLLNEAQGFSYAWEKWPHGNTHSVEEKQKVVWLDEIYWKR